MWTERLPGGLLVVMVVLGELMQSFGNRLPEQIQDYFATLFLLGIFAVAAWWLLHIRGEWIAGREKDVKLQLAWVLIPAVAALVLGPYLAQIKGSDNVVFHVVEGPAIHRGDFQALSPEDVERRSYNISDQEGQFGLVGRISDGKFILYPISVFMRVEITNASDRQETIDGISIQKRSNDHWWRLMRWWHSLCYVSSSEKFLVWLPSPHPPVDAYTQNWPMLEDAIKDKPIAPGQTVRGWIAFECFESTVVCLGREAQISLSTKSGKTVRQEVNLEPKGENLLDLRLSVTPSNRILQFRYEESTACQRG
jgi:hypothetical protein